MRLLLDTHALLWWLQEHPALSREAYRQIADPANDVAVSAASVWEISIKQSAGRLRPPGPLPERLRQERFRILSISVAHALAAGALPLHHKDPFDRMLVAQAQLEGLTLVTRDPEIAAYDVPRLLA